MGKSSPVQSVVPVFWENFASFGGETRPITEKPRLIPSSSGCSVTVRIDVLKELEAQRTQRHHGGRGKAHELEDLAVKKGITRLIFHSYVNLPEGIRYTYRI